MHEAEAVTASLGWNPDWLIGMKAELRVWGVLAMLSTKMTFWVGEVVVGEILFDTEAERSDFTAYWQLT